MSDLDLASNLTVLTTRKDTDKKKRMPKKIVYPRRDPSIVVQPKRPVLTTPDKTTCVQCGCFPKEDRYVKNKKLNRCQHTPLTLYELAAQVVEGLPFPEAFSWDVFDVAKWMSKTVGLSQYRKCILVNEINGMKLIMFEDPSNLPKINIHDFLHIKLITSHIRNLYGTDLVQFSRSINLPPRPPMVHCTWFKSRTGPNWGIRNNWNRGDVLRWLKILMPEPCQLDHWDFVWSTRPDFPKVMVGRRPKNLGTEPGGKGTGDLKFETYKPDKSGECMVRRKFIINQSIPADKQWIWTQTVGPFENPFRRSLLVDLKRDALRAAKETRHFPKKIDLSGLRGQELLLAKRKMPRQKFFGSLERRD